MNLATTIWLYGGGPGSGCNGPNCGRPEGEHQKGDKPGDWGVLPKGHPEANLYKTPLVKEKKWRRYNENSVGGYFRHGTTIAEMYKTLTAKEGEWHPISDFETTHAGKANIKNRIVELKYTGKRSGLWHVEVSGENVRIYLKERGEVTQPVTSDAKLAKAEELAKNVIQLQKEYTAKYEWSTNKGEMDSTKSKKLFNQYFKDMGVSDASRDAMEQGVRSWTGSANSESAQAWRAAAMQFYGRKPEDEYTDGESKNLSSKLTDQMRNGVMAMKAYASAYARLNDVNVVYRGIGGKAGNQIEAAVKNGAKAVEVPINSLSSWSSKKSTADNFGNVYLKMKIDPDNVWAIHKATPWLFSAHSSENEYVIGVRKPTEKFSKADITL